MATSVSQRWDLEDAVSECNFGNEQEVVTLITNQYTPLYFDKIAITRLYEDPLFLESSVVNMYPTMNFDYGQGDIPRNKVYHPPYIPMGIQNFQLDNLPRPDQVAETGPSEGNSNCIFCYIDIPFGGVSYQQGMIVRRDYRTPQVCARDIASSAAYWDYAGQVIESRMMAEQRTMQDFKNFVRLYTAGHKIVLEPNSPITAANPPQSIQNTYPETYETDLFPQVIDPNAILPLSFAFLQNTLLQYIMQDYTFRFLAKAGPRGPVWEVEVDSDWYANEVINNPQWTENLRWEAPAILFQGQVPDSRLYPGNVEGLGNYRFVIDATLPRYAPDGAGGIVEVQKFITTPVEVNSQTILNKAWVTAPFGVAYFKNPLGAKLLTQPGITTNQGITIPDVQRTGWIPWNEFDPLCNPEKLKPYWKFHFRMGFMPYQPYRGIAVLFRRTMPNIPETPNCTPYPIVNTTAATEDCDVLNGPCSGRTPLPASITQTLAGNQVIYTHTECGGTRYVDVRVQFQPNRPGGLMNCECPGQVRVTYSDDTFDTATILNTRWATSYLPYDHYFLDLGSGNSVPTGECIVLIQCLETPLNEATITFCTDTGLDGDTLPTNQVMIYVDQPIDCTGGLSVITVDGSGSPVTVTIVSSDIEALRYIITAVGLTCASSGGLEGATFACNAP